jgi:hypothetical protein
MAYLVIRLVPTSPVDGATFATYLEDLEIQIYQANPAPSTQPLRPRCCSAACRATPFPPRSRRRLR